jgi:hypothetical protein
MRVKRREKVFIPLENTPYHVPLLMTPKSAIYLHDREKGNGYTEVLAAMSKLLPEEYLDRPFLTRFGDGPAELPLSLHKTEFANGVQTIVVPYDWLRYGGPVLELAKHRESDRPFEEKEAVAFWRGATTAYNWDPSGGPGAHPNLRKGLVTRRGNSSSKLVDVGLHEIIQDAVEWKV